MASERPLAHCTKSIHIRLSPAQNAPHLLDTKLERHLVRLADAEVTTNFTFIMFYANKYFAHSKFSAALHAMYLILYHLATLPNQI